MSPPHAMVQPSYGRPWQLGPDTGHQVRPQQGSGQGSLYTVQQEFLQGLYFLPLPIPTLARVGPSLGYPAAPLPRSESRGLGRGFMYQGAKAEPEDYTFCCKHHAARWLARVPLSGGSLAAPRQGAVSLALRRGFQVQGRLGTV